MAKRKKEEKEKGKKNFSPKQLRYLGKFVFVHTKKGKVNVGASRAHNRKYMKSSERKSYMAEYRREQKKAKKKERGIKTAVKKAVKSKNIPSNRY